MEFMSWIPALIVFIIIIPPMLIIYFSKSLSSRNRAKISFSSINLFDKVKPSLKHRLRFIPFILLILAMTMFIIAFARPRIGDELAVDYTEGIAIQMVLDRSSSMTKEPIRVDNEIITYFQAAKGVAQKFIKGNSETLEGRPNDLIGFSSFSGYVQENCPLTLDHDNLTRIIESINPVEFKQEDGTAIGDAIYHSVLTLISTDEYFRQSKDNYTVKSKVIILLTDGFNNTGMNIQDASKFAIDNDIKIYPILFAGKELQNEIRRRNKQVLANLSVLEETAKETKGRFFLAFDNQSLIDVYNEIDKLEKSKIKESYFRYYELFPTFILIGLGLIVLSIILSNTVFRQLP
ncbi:MAG: vWA domain-containing protein [Spirochaetota bacterium]